jgi:hypothetical protein
MLTDDLDVEKLPKAKPFIFTLEKLVVHWIQYTSIEVDNRNRLFGKWT